MGGEAPLPPGHPPVAGGASAPAPKPGESVSGTVTLSPAVKDKAAAGTVLYVMAKKDGQTIAVVRVERPTFPHAFRLSAADAMNPGTPFTGPLDVTARLSMTGDAIAARGDVEGTAKGVAVGTTGLGVTLDTVRQ